MQVSWFDMQQALYNALPTGSVSVDNNFVGYEEDSQASSQPACRC